MPRLTAPVVADGALALLPQPVLAGAGFVLRPWAVTDAPAVAAAFDDPGIRQWHARSLTLDEAVAWVELWPAQWQAERAAAWAIADNRAQADPRATADDRVLGQIGLRVINLAEGTAAISYWVLPAARGRRLAARALTVLSRWAFERVGLHRLELNHSTLNLPSCRVAERAGYPAEGTKRSEVLHADGWHDMHSHARIATDPALDVSTEID